MIVLGLVASLLTVTTAFAATNYHWYVGGKPVGASPVSVKGAGETVFSTGWVWAGIEFEADCSGAESSGSIQNPAGGAAGTLSNGSLNLSGCTVKYPRGKNCQIGMMNAGRFEPGVIRFNPMRGNAAETVLAGQPSGIKFAPASGATYVTYRVDKCTVGINGDYSYGGNLNAGSSSSNPGSYEFTKGSSGLVWAGNPAWLTGNLKLTDQSGSSPVTVAP